MYTEDEAKAYTDVCVRYNGDGYLQRWRLAPSSTAHARDIANTVSKIHHGAVRTILDLGCGTGALLHDFGLFFPISYRFGINKFACQLPSNVHRHESEKFIVGDIEDSATYPDLKMDLITCCYTLGHCDIDNVMTAVSGSLADDGLFYIWGMAPATREVDSILGYKLRMPGVVISAAARAGMRMIRCDIYSLHAVSTMKGDKYILNKAQRKEWDRVATPVAYVFAKNNGNYRSTM